MRLLLLTILLVVELTAKLMNAWSDLLPSDTVNIGPSVI